MVLEAQERKKPIKEFTPEDWKEYRHKRYERDRKHRLEYQKEYYRKNEEKIKKRENNRYRIKCGLVVR